MPLFNNIKRQAHEVNVAGNTVYVRSLTTSEWVKISALIAERDLLGQTLYLFQCGVCDKDGNTIHADLTREDMEKELTDVPLAYIKELTDAVINVTRPEKKS